MSDTTMVPISFQRSSSEHGIYTRTRGGSRLVVDIFVDDLVISSADWVEIQAFKTKM
jgi:hypothetical protein